MFACRYMDLEVAAKKPKIMADQNENKQQQKHAQLAQYFDVSVADFLTEMKLWDKDRKVIVLNSSVEPKAGFQLLIDHHIRSAPVRDHDSFIGFLDIRDLVSFVIFAVKESHRHHYQSETQLTVVQERAPAKFIPSNISQIFVWTKTWTHGFFCREIAIHVQEGNEEAAEEAG